MSTNEENKDQWDWFLPKQLHLAENRRERTIEHFWLAFSCRAFDPGVWKVTWCFQPNRRPWPDQRLWLESSSKWRLCFLGLVEALKLGICIVWFHFQTLWWNSSAPTISCRCLPLVELGAQTELVAAKKEEIYTKEHVFLCRGGINMLCFSLDVAGWGLRSRRHYRCLMKDRYWGVGDMTDVWWKIDIEVLDGV